MSTTAKHKREREEPPRHMTGYHDKNVEKTGLAAIGIVPSAEQKAEDPALAHPAAAGTERVRGAIKNPVAEQLASEVSHTRVGAVEHADMHWSRHTLIALMTGSIALLLLSQLYRRAGGRGATLRF